MATLPGATASLEFSQQKLTLERSASSPAGQGKDLAARSKEFESILLGQWLQGAQASFADLPGGDDERDPGGDQFMSFAVQQLARKLTDAGGIGITPLVAKALESSTSKQSEAIVPGTRGGQ